jgi:hypothetical protein
VSTQMNLSARSAGSVRENSTLNELGKPSPQSLPSWYSDGLQPKIVRAVRDGRVDHARAADLHRLMTELLGAQTARSERGDGVRRMDALVSI